MIQILSAVPLPPLFIFLRIGEIKIIRIWKRKDRKKIMVLKKYFGDKAFYRMILTIAVPIMIQNGITNFVSLLDNIMVGNLGTEAMSGVSIVNQFVFIFNLLIFGAVSAAGIFTAQYHGIGNREGKMYTCLLYTSRCV